MLKRKKLWCFCPLLFLAMLTSLPNLAVGQRRPMRTLTNAPKGVGERYVPSEEGQMVSGTVFGAERVGLIEDTMVVWLVEVPDETTYIQSAEEIRIKTSNVKVIIDAEVTFEATEKYYQYSYILRNLKSSPREMDDFELSFDPNLPFWDFTAPDLPGWSAWAREKEVNPETWASMGRPLRWSGVLSRGDSVEGLSFKSPVLPNIVRCWAGDIIPDDRKMTLLQGQTVGPVVPPDPFDPDTFLARLNTIVDGGLKEGWIESEDVAGNLKAKLELARQSVEREDKEQLKSVLKQLLDEIEKQNGRSLLSEAYGLLKCNVKYWVDRLE